MPFKTIDKKSSKAGNQLVGLYEVEKKADTSHVSTDIKKVIEQYVSDKVITGKLGDWTSTHVNGGKKIYSCFATGLGKASECDVERLRKMAGNVQRQLKSTGIKSVQVNLPKAVSKLDNEAVGEALAMGATLSCCNRAGMLCFAFRPIPSIASGSVGVPQSPQSAC